MRLQHLINVARQKGAYCIVNVAYQIGPHIRQAFVNTLSPVTRPHHFYSTTLVIIILIDNLKYVIIFVYVLVSSMENSISFRKCISVSK